MWWWIEPNSHLPLPSFPPHRYQHPGGRLCSFHLRFYSLMCILKFRIVLCGFIFGINSIISYISFCNLLFSHNIVFLKFIQVDACRSSSYILKPPYNFFIQKCIDFSLFIPPIMRYCITGYLQLFLLLQTMGQWKIFACISLCKSFSSVCTWKQNYQVIELCCFYFAVAKCSVKWVTQLCSHKQCLTILVIPHPHGSCMFLNSKLANPTGTSCSLLLWLLDLHFPEDVWGWGIFTCFLAICASPVNHLFLPVFLGCLLLCANLEESFTYSSYYFCISNRCHICIFSCFVTWWHLLWYRCFKF